MNPMMLIYLLIGYLVVINFLTFILFGVDKKRSKHSGKHHHPQRIAEATLLWLAVFGGSMGAILGMHAFHHKTQHKKFTVLLPLILILQLVLAGWICYELIQIYPINIQTLISGQHI